MANCRVGNTDEIDLPRGLYLWLSSPFTQGYASTKFAQADSLGVGVLCFCVQICPKMQSMLGVRCHHNLRNIKRFWEDCNIINLRWLAY